MAIRAKTRAMFALAASLVVFGLGAGVASAAFIECTPEMTIEEIMEEYASNPAFEFRCEDKVFKDWSVTSVGSPGGATSPDANEIKVVAGYWNSGMYAGQVGLRFNSGWLAGQNQVSSSTIRYKVETDPGWSINAALLYIDQFEADSNSLVSVSTNLYGEEPGPGVDDIDDLYVFKNGLNGDTQQTDANAEDILEDMLWIVTGVTANANNQDGRIAHITEFFQTFGQIPEPATLVLIGTGALLLLRRRRR